MGLNATERPGAVYLASALAAHARKGLGIYDKECIDYQRSNEWESKPAGSNFKYIFRLERSQRAIHSGNGKRYFKWCKDAVFKTVDKPSTDVCGCTNLLVDRGGYSSRFLTKAEMPATMIRLNIVKGIGPVVQLVEGYTVGIPDDVSDQIWKRTDYTWPCTWFVPGITKEGTCKTADDVMNHWGANHGAISYGHVGADVITLCSMLRIPVCMHNVPEKDIFRPACWNAYGMDKEGQDYRACNAYGPLYK